MRAVRLHGVGDLRVEDVPAPGAPGQGEVLIRVTAAGICGSDIHNYRTGLWLSRAPSIPGHELTGVVIAAGAETGFRSGETVVADSRFWCGICPACQAGQRHLCARLGFVGEVCDGGFAEEVLLPARLVHRVDPTLPPAIAAMAEPLAVAFRAAARCCAAPGSTVLVAGCGPIGGLTALTLVRAEANVLVADRNAARAERVAAVTGARPVALTPQAVSDALVGRPLLAAVEATGSPAALSALVSCMSAGATVALVGIYHGSLTLDPNALVEREITLAGCHAFHEELAIALAFVSDWADDLSRFIDREVDLEGVPDAYARLAAGSADGLKTIVRPQGLRWSASPTPGA